jgi:hypothetical protein
MNPLHATIEELPLTAIRTSSVTARDAASLDLGRSATFHACRSAAPVFRVWRAGSLRQAVASGRRAGETARP